MSKKVVSILLTLIIAVGMFQLVSCSEAETRHNGGLDIVTTVFPPYDFARAVAGEDADIHMLLSPGAESHTYEPTPKDIIKIQNCDLFICIGGIGESWVDNIISSLGGDINVLYLMDTVDTVEEVIAEGMEDDEHVEEDAGGEIEYDEHIWTSPKNAAVMVSAIADRLCELAPADAQLFRSNADAYIADIGSVDADLAAFFENSDCSTIVFGDRFPFRYFADEFGLKYYAAFPGCSEETEPSAATIAFLIDKVKSEHIKTVFYLEFSSHAVADTVASAAGAQTAMLHSCHNVSRAELEAGVTYVSLMRQNLAALEEYFG
ncbi:MAG: metal ABC transporter substrate-binding protein [Eubacteriales bacterium]